jgi:hypothetical protein
VLAQTTGGRAGIAGTIDVRGGELVPRTAQVALRDVAPWGPSGRIQGTEYADVMIAAGATGTATPSFSAAVVANASSALPDGTIVSVRLLAVLGSGDHPVETLVVARDDQGEVLCSALTEVVTTAANAATGEPSAVPAEGTSILAGRCASLNHRFVATIAAVPGGAGSVSIEGADPTVETGGGAETAVAMRLDPYPGDSAETVLARRITDDGSPAAGPATAVLLPSTR